MNPTRASLRPRSSVLRVLALAAALGGCARTTLTPGPRTGYAPTDAVEDVEFWHALAERAAVSNDEALHGLIVLEAGADPHGSYAQRVAHARERGWIGDDWNERALTAARRGTIARALLRILDIEGGVMLRALGPTERYALRELVYLRIIPASTDNQTLSGAEFLGVIGRAQDHIALAQLAADRARPARPSGPPGPVPAGTPAAATDPGT
ncbi:MAG TPA: hypothetical protein VD963_11325 [Phycisphaerales bacterium]|nr:hypothetical protein [Phycisphaerales bacterium]